MRSYLFATSSLLIGLISLGCHSDPPPPSADAALGVVTLEVQSLDGTAETIEIADVADGATLESVMRSVGQTSIELSGGGATAFVHSIGGIETDASQGWTFKVDGEFANQGIGQTVLHPPTTIQWTFGEFEM